MVGSYLYSQQNLAGSWSVDWSAQWKAELKDRIGAFLEQAQRAAGVLVIPVEDLLAAQNIDDPNGSHPCLHGGNWNFLPTEGMVEPN
jgi:hypothetical protein